MLILQIQMAKICKQVQRKRCLRNRLRLQLRLRQQLQRQPLRHCCRKCDNLATNMRWLGGGTGVQPLPPKEDITQCICVCASLGRWGGGGVCAAYARLHLSAKHKNETKWRTGRQLPERLLHTRVYPTQPATQSSGNLLPISTANCQLVPLLSSDPFCASCPGPAASPATGGNLSIEINAHLWRAIQKSLRFSHSMHCVCLRQATEPSHFFTAKIPCRLRRQTALIRNVVREWQILNLCLK